eukprot:TRINITY_DN6505_c0_g1_i1.p1 TRINITY_DN6505_c0_g1~~TRINITY_DN6505_c0_g1_i1.p1  ORF type:complete len:248 (+),score=71.72 TRINITY_DN6505_c0_g1_i1:114-857(+)
MCIRDRVSTQSTGGLEFSKMGCGGSKSEQEAVNKAVANAIETKIERAPPVKRTKTWTQPELDALTAEPPEEGKAPATWSSVADNDFGVNFKHPSSWEVVKAPQKTAGSAMRTVRTGHVLHKLHIRCSSELGISTQKYSDPIEEGKWTSTMKSIVSSSSANGGVVIEGPTVDRSFLGMLTVHGVSTFAQDDGTTSRVEETMALLPDRDGLVCLVRFVADVPEWDKFGPFLNAMVDSMTLNSVHEPSVG